MRFLIRKRRQAPAVIIVALIDILIVLLIFLMVTTTFKQQPALKLSLPESTQAQKSGANDEARMIVSIDPAGSLRVGPEAKPVTLDRFKSQLVEAAAKTPNLELAINADKSAPVGQLIKVLDVSKEAKVIVKIITKEPAAVP
jgi:biopolymer transport protein ExbD